METSKKNVPENVEAYISTFPLNVQGMLRDLRRIIKEVVPEATEKISYAMPSYILNGYLLHFAGYRNHIGFYTGPSALNKLEKELTGYKRTKGAVQFPLDKPLPLELISKIVKLCSEENRKQLVP